MATQVQIRGTSQTTQEARTLVSRELDINTTDNRLCVHNGSTAGGVRHVNMFDQQNNEFNYAITSGTNAITATMQIAPAAYVTGQVFWLKILNTNTSSCTLNINSLGAKSIKKLFNGSLSNLSENDLISGQMIAVVYDGTQFQVVSGSSSQAGKKSWVPSSAEGSFSYTEAYYVDYGDSVTVAIEFSCSIAYEFAISGLPFSPNIAFGGVGAQSRSGARDEQFSFYLNESGSTINVIGVDQFTRYYNAHFTYIKN